MRANRWPPGSARRPQDLVFTSGGTEADALAIHALGAGRRVIVGATEHDAVRAAAPGAGVLPVDRDGVADLDALEAWLRGRPAGAGLPDAGEQRDRHASSRSPRPPSSAAATARCCMSMRCRRRGGWMSGLPALGAHSLAISSHKLGGPPGAGALLLAPEVAAIAPLIAGGGQERGRRGGTPPLPAIAGFAAAASVARGRRRRWRHCATRPRRRRSRQGAVVCGGGAPRLANTTCLALPGVRADAQVIALDLDGIAVSAGAACSSGKVTASHVLAAMGLGRACRPGDPRLAAVERDRRRRRRLCRRIPAHGGPAARGAGATRRLNPHWPP